MNTVMSKQLDAVKLARRIARKRIQPKTAQIIPDKRRKMLEEIRRREEADAR